jgi:hypothetical protein
MVLAGGPVTKPAEPAHQFGDSFLQCLLIPPGNRDFSALCKEKAGSGQSNAAVATGDDSSWMAAEQA